MARKSKKRKKNPSSSSLLWLGAIGVGLYFLFKGSGSSTTNFTPQTPKEEVKKKIIELQDRYLKSASPAERHDIAFQIVKVLTQIGALSKAEENGRAMQADPSPENIARLQAEYEQYLNSYGVSKDILMMIRDSGV